MPTTDAIELPAGVSAEDMKELLSVDAEGWKKELADVKAEHYSRFGERLPKELNEELSALEVRLNA
jgi:phosphoenolpyruvate carboxykinase (GTP)